MADDRCPTCGHSRKTRSREQNAYTWGVVYKHIAEHTGHSTEEVHEFMKVMFLPRRWVVIANQEEQIQKSTTDLTTEEFAEYLTRVIAFASQELGLLIPKAQ